MGPGPPPLGPWGASRGVSGGGPDPNSPGQNHSSPLGFGIVFYDDFDIDFWSSWARFGLRLGSHFRSFWRLGRPQLVPRPSSNRLNFEKAIDHETMRFPMLLMFFRPTWRPKIAPRRVQDRLGSFFWPLVFSLRFWIVFDFILVPFWMPKWLPRGARKLVVRPLV